MKTIFRMLLSLLVSGLVFAAWGADAPEIELNASFGNSRQTGREMQDDTRRSIARAYGRAWETLSRALAENRADLLDSTFVGAARDHFAEAIMQQRASGISTRYVDRGHKVDVLFYSPEGLSVQLRDRAQLEIQVLDGDTVIHRERVTLTHIALLTPTEVTWKVRVLQAVPE